MSEEIIVSANNLHKAIKLGAKKLGCKVNQVDYKILSNVKKSFFNIEIKIKVCKKTGYDYNDEDGNRDGYFKIQYKDGYAYLTVFPPKTFGRPIYSEDVINRFKILNVNFFNIIALDKIIENADGISKKIIKWQDGNKILSKVDFNIIDNDYKAFITIKPPTFAEGEVDEKYLIKIIKDKGIIFGVKTENIIDAVNNKIYNREILIAEGKKPITGNLGITKYYFNTDPGKPYIVDRFGKINLKELNFINNVKKETLLAELIPPVNSQNGKDIYGRIIPAETLKSSHIKPGKNTYLNGNKIYSIIDGNAFVKDGFVNVESVLVLKNVDYSTGNINFDGAVHISGTVADGFKVFATGIIEINDCVGKAVICADSDIILKSGINGNNEGSIESGGLVIARFIESANVLSQKDLIVEEVIMHSKILTHGQVILKGRRAELIGGKTLVKKGIHCKKLGSINGVETIVYCGIDPDLIIILDELKIKIENLNTRIREESLNIQHIEKEFMNVHVDDHDKINLENLKKNLTELNRQHDDALRQYNDIFHNLIPDKQSKIIAEEKIYNGVTIHFGKELYKTAAKDLSRTILHIENNKIIESGINQPREQIKTDPI